MTEWLTSIVTAVTVYPWLSTLICAMLPLIEMRGAIPLGAVLGLNPWMALVIALPASILPPIAVYFFFRFALKWLEQRGRLLFLTRWIHKRFDKHADGIKDSRFWGLIIFVAIPLPGTGGWTGSAIAGMLEMKPKSALTALVIGQIISGVLITLLVQIGVLVLN